MSNPCTAATCLNGNCPGCKNGIQNCFDPRCFPDCPECKVSTTSNTNWIIIVIILVLLGVLLILSFIIGYDWYTKGKKAGEPKNLTINKHVHNVKPPSIVVNSPTHTTSSIPVEKSFNLSQEVSYEAPVEKIIPSDSINSISSEGINLSLEGLPPKYSMNNPISLKNIPSKIEGFE
jgi:hypothetical protein